MSSIWDLSNAFDLFLYRHGVDLNGASRMIILSALMIAVMAFVFAHTAIKMLKEQISPVAALPGIICAGIVANVSGVFGRIDFTVRNRCRPYYIGCGDNQTMKYGLALSIALLLFGAVMVAIELRYGWLVMAFALYQVDYFAQFTHFVPSVVRLALIARVCQLACLSLPGGLRGTYRLVKSAMRKIIQRRVPSKRA